MENHCQSLFNELQESDDERLSGYSAHLPDGQTWNLRRACEGSSKLTQVLGLGTKKTRSKDATTHHDCFRHHDWLHHANTRFAGLEYMAENLKEQCALSLLKGKKIETYPVQDILQRFYNDIWICLCQGDPDQVPNARSEDEERPPKGENCQDWYVARSKEVLEEAHKNRGAGKQYLFAPVYPAK